ncbi:MAG: bifunctional oligoribonuclease/PAP phosphatase NrnA [Bacilli bacterium]|nr:bifunctional oligoribonuclease/PAP phosphatase NrnA [Bacilli bacterium]
MDKLNPIIKDFLSSEKREITKIISAIKKYDRIAIFRHIMPDYDALGSQYGLATWIKDNFPNKEVRVLGDNHVTFTPRIFPEMDSLNEDWFATPFLGIILDCANKSRIADPRWKKAKYKIKIDHHPVVENFGKASIVKTNASAAAENIVSILLNAKGNYVLSPEAARYFYIGIVGDSGRFMYSSTSNHTFAIASELIKTGINISKIYQEMYLKQVDDLYVTAYVLNNFKISEHGVAYYVLDKKTQDDLKITTERGKENVNLFSNIEGVNVWCSITEDVKDHCWRVSIRSKEKAINGVAAKWGGGGHAQASGAKLNNLSELDEFVQDLEN